MLLGLPRRLAPSLSWAPARTAPLVRRHLATTEPEDDKAAERRAQELMKLSMQCQSRGDWTGALRNMITCVDCYRGRVHINPEKFVLALNMLGNYYRNLDHYDEGYKAFQEAVAVSRALVPDLADNADQPVPQQELDGQKFVPLLAMSLSHMGTIQCQMCSFHAGIQTTLEGLGRHQHYLHSIKAGTHANQLYLTTLHSLASKLDIVGDYDRSTNMALECVAGFIMLESTKPGEFAADVGMAMHTASEGFFRMGQLDHANSMAVHALAQRTKVQKNAPEVNDTMDLLSEMFVVQGKTKEALEMSLDALQSRRFMAAANPELQNQLVCSLFVTANAQHALGQTADVVASTKEAVELLLPILKQHPNIFYPAVKHLSTASARLQQAGIRDLARSAATAALDIYTVLADRAPSSKNFAHALAEARKVQPSS